MEIKLLLLLLTLGLIGPTICYAKKNKYGTWSYKAGKHGPRNWGRIKGGASCLGANQSPIDINTMETIEREYPPFTFRGYNSDGMSGNARPVKMINNGKTVKVTFDGDYLIRGGGLPSLYRAAQMHFHWGADWTKGSEHTLNGQSFPAELHIVHYDAQRYQNLGEAVKQPDGLAVLGFFLRVGPHNPGWDAIINQLSSIRYIQSFFDYTQQPFRLDSLLPNNLERFYRYKGSLTTPGCYESVIWTVFATPIELSEVQLSKFRTITKLASPPSQVRARFGGREAERGDDLLVNNFRPVQRLNYRDVYQSFEQEEPEYDSDEAVESSDGWSLFGTGAGAGGTGRSGAGGAGGHGTGTGVGVGTGTGTGGFYNNYGMDTGGYNNYQYDHIDIPGGTGGFSNYYNKGGAGNTGADGGTGVTDGTFGQTDTTFQNQGNPAGQGIGHNGQGGGGAGGTGEAGGQGAGGGQGGGGDPWGGYYGGAGGHRGDAGYGDGDYYNGGGYVDAYAYGGGGGGGDGNGVGGAYDPYDPYAYQDPYALGPDTGGQPGSIYGATGGADGTGTGAGAGVVGGSDPEVVNQVNGAKTEIQENPALKDAYNYEEEYVLLGAGGPQPDPYTADGNEQLAGLAHMWHQLLNGEHTNPEDAAYYHNDFGTGLGDLTTNTNIEDYYTSYGDHYL